MTCHTLNIEIIVNQKRLGNIGSFNIVNCINQHLIKKNIKNEKNICIKLLSI